MPYNDSTNTFERIWKFVDAFSDGDEVNRPDLDAALDDLASGFAALYADLYAAIPAPESVTINYLGLAGDDPTEGVAGAALAAGNWYIQTPGNITRVYTGAEWTTVSTTPGATDFFRTLSALSGASEFRAALSLGALALLNMVGSGQISNGAVTEAKLANGAVVASKIGPGAVTLAALSAGLLNTSAETFKDSDSVIPTSRAVRERIDAFAYTDDFARRAQRNHVAGGLGSYAFMKNAVAASTGTVLGGGGLDFSGTDLGNGGAPSGSWRCMGETFSGGNATLWLRIA